MKSISSARNFYIWGIIGAFLIILADLLPWHSGYTGFDLILLEGFTFWFPLFGGSIILLGVILALFRPKHQIAPVLLQFSGLSLVMIFLVDYLQNNWDYLGNAQAGFYSLFIGIFIVFLEIIGALIAKIPASSEK